MIKNSEEQMTEQVASFQESWDESNAALATLMGRLTKERVAWQPHEGSMVGGEVVGIGIGTSEYGDYPLIEIDTPAAVVQVHCFHMQLRNAITRQHLQVGDLIAIVYRGRVEGKRNMASYTVEIKHAQSTTAANLRTVMVRPQQTFGFDTAHDNAARPDFASEEETPF